MNSKKLILLISFLLSSVVISATEDFGYCENNVTVKKINISTTRVNPAVIRSRFKIEEGEKINCDSLRRACEDLHDMKIFKELSIRSSALPDGTAEININGEDAYYILPLPFYAGGSSNVFGLLLVEANLFKRGEAMSLFGIYSDDGYMAAGSLAFARSAVSVFYTNQDYTERQYSNGMFNVSGIFGSDKEEDSWGPPVERKVEKDGFGASYSLAFNKYNTLTLGLSTEDVTYPGESGRINKITAGFDTHKNQRSSRGMAGGAGALFGMGLSDKETFLRPLPHVRAGYALGVKYEGAGSFTDSDFNVNTGSADLLATLEFTKRHMLALKARGAWSPDGPSYEMTSTVKNLLPGFGSYSREYRGEGGFGGGMSFTYYLSRTGMGLFAVEPFVEGSVVYVSGKSYSQGGAGAGVFYKFWRFPLSLGIKVTKNLTDGDVQTSFMASAF